MPDVDLLLRGAPTTGAIVGPVTVASRTDTAAGDYLLVVADVDYRPASDLAISDTDGVDTWELLGVGDDGNLVIKAWLGKVTTAGARSITVTQNGGASGLHVHCYTLDPSGGRVTLDDVTAAPDRSSPFAHASLDLASAKDFLLCAHGQVQFAGTATNYGDAPSGMTAGAENGVNSQANSGMQSCWQVLSAAGATGTRTQTSAPSSVSFGAGLMVALRSEGDEPPPSGDALVEDFEDTAYVTPISGTWARSTTRAHGGSWSLRSADISDDQTSDAVVTVPAGATSVQFWYLTSSEANFDGIEFFIDGVFQFHEDQGDAVWRQSAVYPLDGAGQLTFRYIKDGSQSAGDDSAYVDDLTFTVPAPTSDEAAVLQGWGDPLPASDEFDYTGAPDPTKWNLYDGPGHAGNGTRDPERVTVADGRLRITGLPGGSTGGMAHTFDQQYGRWEVRARTLPEPGATGNPYHAVAIVWPRSNEWPVHGEYDFWEVNVGDTDATAFLHYPHPADVAVQQEQATQAGVDVAQWHNYALEWTPTSLVGYLDGQEWFRFSGGAGPNGRDDIQAMPAGHLTLQLDNFYPEAGLQQAYLDVDWARIYAAPVPGPGVFTGADVAEHPVNTVLTRTASELGADITSRTWTVLSGPASVGSVIGTTAALSWTPTTAGTYLLEYEATNSAGSSRDQITVQVEPPPAIPAEASIAGALTVTAAEPVHGRAARAAVTAALTVEAGAAATYRASTTIGGALTVTAAAATTHHAAATITGALTVDTAATPARAAATTAGGALTVTATASRGQAVAATVDGHLTVNAIPGEAGQATVTGRLTVTAQAWQTMGARAQADGALTVAAAAFVDRRDARAAITAALTVSADGRRAHPAAATLTGALQVTADATRVKLGTTDVTGRLTVTTDATRVVLPSVVAGGMLAVYAETETARGGGLNISVWAVDRAQGGRLVPLPHLVKVDVSDIANDAGAINLDYPANTAGFDLLRRDVAADSDLEVEVWLGGRRETAMRGYLDAASGDDVTGGVWSFTGSLMPIRLAQTVIEPQAGDPKKEFRAAAATPGAMGLLLHQQAVDRGSLTDITPDFTADRDSTGVPWPEVFTGKWSPGTTYLQWVQTLVDLGLCETEVTADKRWRLYVFGRRGRDLTGGAFPVTLRRGQNLGQAGRRATVRDAGTEFLVAGGEGIYTRVPNVDARTRRGRAVEVYSSVGNTEDPDALTAAAQRTAATLATGPDERSFALALGAGHPRPGDTFLVGDTVRVDTDGRLGPDRVAQWSLTWDPSGPSGSAVTGDLIRSRAAALLARITAAESGSIIVGTSDVGEDTGIPLAPDGVVVGSSAFVDGLDVYSSVQVGWLPVEHNVDGTAATDLAGYVCEYALASSPGQWRFGFDVGSGRNSATFSTLPGRIVYVRVLAYDHNGNRSAWSDVAEHVTEDDTTPPPVASAPVCSNFLGTLKITWDGRSEAGTEMVAAAPDFSHVQVHLSTGASFLPDASTLVGRMYGPGDYVVTDLPYGVTHYARLVAVDIRDNWADPSGQGTATPGRVANVDLGDDAVDRAQIRHAAIGNAQISDLAVNNAKIADVEMGKVTAGQIRAAMIFTSGGLIGTRGPGGTGPGWDGDSAGIRFYNSAGTNTINLNAFTGNALVTGEYRSALTGRHFRINPGGSIPDEIRFYRSSGIQYGRIRAIDTGQGIGVNIRSGVTSGYLSAETLVTQDSAAMLYGDIENGVHRSRMVVDNDHSYVSSPVVDISADTRQATGDALGHRVSFFHVMGNGLADTITVLEYRRSANGFPFLKAPSPDCGLVFEVGRLFTTDRSQNPFRHGASSYDVFSSEDTKTDIADLRAVVDPLRAIRRARARKWTYRWERWTTPAPTEENPDPAPVPVENPPVRFGPIAEELPEVMVTPMTAPTGETHGGVSLGDQIGVLWGALGQIGDQQIRTVIGRTPLTGRMMAGDERDLDVTWDEAPLEVPTGGVVTVHAGVAWMGKVTAVIVPGSLTMTGCTVRARALAVVAPTGGQPITLEPQGLYLWTPPYQQEIP